MNPTMRQNVRNTVTLQRRCLREAELNSRRHIAAVVDDKKTTCSNSTELVAIIANKLKTKQHISQSDLIQLKNSIMDSEETISAFLQVNGAIHGLIRELAGNDAIKQINTISCFCNLALGDEKSALALTKACGTYLVALLDSSNREIIITTAWTIGNLASAGLRPNELIKSQGAIDKLLERMETHSQEDIIDAITYALTHFVYVAKDMLGTADMHRMVQITMKQKEISPHMYQLLVLLSCHELFPTIFQQNDMQIFIERLLRNLNTILSKLPEEKSDKSSAIGICRILANLCSLPDNCELFLNILGGDFSMIEIMNCDSGDLLKKNLFWLLGNIVRFAPESSRKNVFLSYVSTVLTV